MANSIPPFAACSSSSIPPQSEENRDDLNQLTQAASQLALGQMRKKRPVEREEFVLRSEPNIVEREESVPSSDPSVSVDQLVIANTALRPYKRLATRSVLTEPVHPSSYISPLIPKPIPLSDCHQPIIPSAVPPPPRKAVERIRDLFRQNALTIQQGRGRQGKPFFLWHLKSISLDVQHHLMNGQYAFIARIAEGQDPVIEGLSNDDLLFKSFRTECIVNSEIGPQAAGHVISQYEQLLELDIPVAEIYNLDEAKRGCGFFLVEYVPYAFPEWDKKSLLSELSDRQKDALRQVKKIFECAYARGIDIDLRPSNVRLREDGKVTLIDLRERALGDDIFNTYYQDMLKSFAVPGGEIWNFLTDSTVYPDEIRSFR